MSPHLSPAIADAEAITDVPAGRPADDDRIDVRADNGATRRATAPTTTGDSRRETGRQSPPASRPAASPTARDDLDADLLKAIRDAATLRQAFYVLVLLIALVGQVTGAVHTLDIPLFAAIPAVAALELGGVVVMANADVRRRLGERALASRVLSAAIAIGAVTFNWFAHPDPLEGGFYAGMSALGYLVWLMHAGNQRRDRLRATGDLPPTTPAYELFGHWLRHPVITARARSIAKADGLDLFDSLKAARAEIQREHRDAAIAKVLHRKIKKAVDPITARIAVHVYDLDEIAARLSATADYSGLTALLAADLVPAHILAASRADGGRRRRRWFGRTSPVPTSPGGPQPSPSRSAVPSAPMMTTTGDDLPPPQPVRSPERDPLPAAATAPRGDESAEGEDVTRERDHAASEEPFEQAGPRDGTGDERAHGDPEEDVRGSDLGEVDDSPHDDDALDDDDASETPAGTAEAVAYWLGKDPDMDLEVLADRIGKSLRSVYRYLPPDYPRKPGLARSRGRQSPD
ncbi:hypothetical protein ACIA59_24400 [Micromonospora haikouensis]|uniref:hypothetical protein n=1 Tax=Micromonospora haikouensis TaxID=686309 RepID=UPI0037BAA860